MENADVLFWINIGAILANCLILFYNARTFNQQTRAIDFSNYFKIVDLFSASWRSLRDSKDKDNAETEFRELMNMIEGICHNLLKGNIRHATRDMTEDYLKEILPKIFSDDRARQLINESISSQDTFINIRKFARRHNIPDVPHQ